MARVPLIAEVDAIVDEEVKMRGQPRFLVPLLRIFDKLNYRSVDAAVCVTPGIRNELIRRGADPDTTVVIHNAAQVDIMYPMEQGWARQQLGLNEEGYIVGFSGTMAPWQGLDLLVRAAKEVLNSSARPVRFVLVGEGQCRPKLQEMVTQMGLSESFLFLPPMPHEQVAIFNNACDVLVCPRYDPRTLRYGMSPLKFWDAVSVGLPVLIPEGGQLEDVLKHLGLPGVFQPGNKKYLSEAILEVLLQT